MGGARGNWRSLPASCLLRGRGSGSSPCCCVATLSPRRNPRRVCCEGEGVGRCCVATSPRCCLGAALPIEFAAREWEWGVAVLLRRHVVASEESPSRLLRGRGWGVAASPHCHLGGSLPVVFAVREREWGVAALLHCHIVASEQPSPSSLLRGSGSGASPCCCVAMLSPRRNPPHRVCREGEGVGHHRVVSLLLWYLCNRRRLPILIIHSLAF